MFENIWKRLNPDFEIELRTAFRSRVKLEYDLVSFFLSYFLSRRTHSKSVFCVAMISRTESQKIFVRKRDENIEIEPRSFVIRNLGLVFVRLQIVTKKYDFVWNLCYDIIKMKTERKVRRHFLLNNWFYALLLCEHLIIDNESKR